jgi:hypothetical protein
MEKRRKKVLKIFFISFVFIILNSIFVLSTTTIDDNHISTINGTFSGSVGIGTTIPRSFLEIAKATGKNEVNLSGMIYVNSTSGSVGVGVTSPLAPLQVGGGNDENSVDSQILIARVVDDTGTGNGHAFSDSSYIMRSGTIAYNSFDARAEFHGTPNFDHYAAFQFSPSFEGTGVITNVYGLISAPIMHSGNITNLYAFYASNMNKVGGVLNNSFGLYVEDQTSGLNNFAIYTNGTANSYLGGRLGIVTTTPLYPLDVNGTMRARNYINLVNFGEDNNLHPVIEVLNSRGTDASPSYLTNGDEIGAVAFREGTSGSMLGGSGMNALATEDWNSGAVGSKLTFFTTPNGAVIKQTRLVLENSGQSYFLGNLGVNGTYTLYPLTITSDNYGFAQVNGSLAIKVYSSIQGNSGHLSILDRNAVNEIELNSFGSSYFNGGSLGIGTTTPSQTLTVSGTANVTSTIVTGLRATYTGGSAFLCVYDNGTMFSSESACA